VSACHAADQLLAIMAPLRHWLNDPATEDLCINRPGEVWVRQRGHFMRHETPLDYDDCFDIGILAGALNQQNVGDRHPLLAADLPDGERLQMVLPPCVPQRTVSLTLRIHSNAVAPLEAVTSRYDLSRWNQWQKRRQARRADYAAARVLRFRRCGWVLS
jgi:type IV secretion system protein VirB11